MQIWLDETVLSEVFARLTVPDRARCFAVCKRWNAVLTNDRSLWRIIRRPTKHVSTWRNKMYFVGWCLERKPKYIGISWFIRRPFREFLADYLQELVGRVPDCGCDRTGLWSEPFCDFCVLEKRIRVYLRQTE